MQATPDTIIAVLAAVSFLSIVFGVSMLFLYLRVRYPDDEVKVEDPAPDSDVLNERNAAIFYLRRQVKHGGWEGTQAPHDVVLNTMADQFTRGIHIVYHEHAKRNGYDQDV